jgi:predicted MPP superfamily phosphohydrolase
VNGIPLLSALLHLLVGLLLLPALADGAGPPAALALGAWLAVSAVLLPMSMSLRRRSRDERPGDVLAWASLLAMGLFSSLFVLSVLRALGLGALALAAWAGASGLVADAAAWRTGTAVAVPLVALVLTAWGLWNARRPARVKTVDVPLKDLPPALHGFRIAQLSDIHVGPTIKGAWLRPLVERVNALDVDVVAITGDLVDGSVPDLSVHVAELAALRSRHGTFFVTGNHEYYSGAPSWIAELRRLGITVLMNEHVVLNHRSRAQPHAGEATLVLAGVADWSAHHFEPSHRSDPLRAIAGAPADARKVLLAHQPRSAPAAADAGFDLQLSGHTHGGQFLPWNFLVPLQQPFVAGLHAMRGLWVYVSRGTGYWGPPKRLGAPSEITELRLVAA